jgi:predicted dehydrogenase
MRLGIVGCGFVADYYVQTLTNYPELEVIGVTDRDPTALARFASHYSLPQRKSLDDLLNDSRVEIVLNLTSPRSHYEVTKACIAAGKHVYSEKPLAMEVEEAAELVALAKRAGVALSSAPCNILSETAQTLWKALRERQVGPVRLVYAEMDDGMVHRMPYRRWSSTSGAPWPARDEFEVGCTFEHAGYYLTWFPAFFGPAQTVTGFSANLLPDKQTDEPLRYLAPDFSVACVTFASGVVARLTCSIVAPHDHRLRIIGDDGVLSTEDCWDYQSAVYIQRPLTIRRRMFISPWKKRYPLLKNDGVQPRSRGMPRSDFARGVAELAASVAGKRTSCLTPEFCLHTTELVIALDHAWATSRPYQVTTTFDPIEPMPWAV